MDAVFVDKPTVEIETPAQVMEKLDEGQFRAIPNETRKVIRKAATEGDIEQLQQLIAAMPDDFAELKIFFMSMVEDLEFETLMKALADESQP